MCFFKRVRKTISHDLFIIIYHGLQVLLRHLVQYVIVLVEDFKPFPRIKWTFLYADLAHSSFHSRPEEDRGEEHVDPARHRRARKAEAKDADHSLHHDDLQKAFPSQRYTPTQVHTLQEKKSEATL